MSLTTFLQQCLTGISLGGAYALIAIGYTLPRENIMSCMSLSFDHL